MRTRMVNIYYLSVKKKTVERTPTLLSGRIIAFNRSGTVHTVRHTKWPVNSRQNKGRERHSTYIFIMLYINIKIQYSHAYSNIAKYIYIYEFMYL